jgi:malate dehydrogenase (oxaloacetate-decarboxylating)
MKEYPPVSESADLVSPVETDLSGFDLINKPMLNKGTAFSEAERDAFHLHGLLPPNVGTLDEQVERRWKVLRAFATDFERYAAVVGYGAGPTIRRRDDLLGAP